MSLISAIQDYIKTSLDLEAGAPVWVNYLGSEPTQYSVVPLGGSRIVETYITGGTVREFPFAFQSMASTADDLERIQTVAFFETFAAWLDAQTNSDVFPTMEEGQYPTKIEALGWGFLYEQGQSDTGVFQIQCKLTYEQGA